MTIVSLTTAARRLAHQGRHVVVVGSTGAGKTTLARDLSRLLGIVHVELDALHWDPHWTPADTPVFRVRVAAALDEGDWTVDGNYSKVRDLVWARADTVIWLDYPLSLILWRLTRRTAWRVFARVELWNGNRERLWEVLCSRDSIFLWALTTYRRRRREYRALFTRPEHAHLTVVRLRAPRGARRLLATVAQNAGSAGRRSHPVS